ncbi:MAG: glycosyltransferase [Candidatus Saccharibacteria bacterium]|nr:glycosyltransferase [Candidatus Saccharibacteria bacterium]
MRYISVIIPTFNRAAYIKEAIDSVLEQNVPKDWGLEVIVTDDGSTDDTAYVLEPYYDKITFLKLPHSGKPSVPRNAAIRAAKGELIAFQDSDDLWAQDKLVKQLPFFDDATVMMSFGNAEIMNMAGDKSGKKIADSKSLDAAEDFRKLLKQNTISTLTVMVRASAFRKTGLFDEADSLRAVEDYELWLRIAASFPRGLRNIDSVLAYYRVHDQNISTSDDLISIERLCNVYETLLDFNGLTVAQRSKVDIQLASMQENWSRLKNELDPASQPKVSVVMGVYNGDKYLHAAIDSILGQTFSDFEFIIINDGSTDSAPSIMKSYKDKRIRVINQSNHGLVYTLNKGVRLARGQYIARQDADDISLPSRLKKEVALLDNDQSLGLVGTFFTYIDDLTEKKDLTICMPTKSLDIKRALYVTNPIGHGTSMYRRSVFTTTGYYTSDYGPTEDLELWRRIADSWEIAIIPESLYLYRINKQSISHTKGEVQHANTARIINEQWSKPFYSKSAGAIIADGKYYKSMDSEFASLTFDQYAAHQIDIGKALLNTGAIKPGVLTAYAAIRLKPKSYKLFIKPIFNCVLDLLGVRN